MLGMKIRWEKKVSITKQDKPWLCEQAFQGEEEYECVSLDDLM